MWPQMTSMTTTMTFSYPMSCDISNERYWLQYSTFQYSFPWPQQWLLRNPCHVTYQMKGNDFSIRPFNVLDQLEVIWPHHDRKCDFRWPPWPQFCPICLKHWKVEYWSHYLSFDMSHDMGYAKVIVVVMEVIWGHIFGHGEVKWPPIGLKHWKFEYWSPSFLYIEIKYGYVL